MGGVQEMLSGDDEDDLLSPRMTGPTRPATGPAGTVAEAVEATRAL
jgi:hypothetical protein